MMLANDSYGAAAWKDTLDVTGTVRGRYVSQEPPARAGDMRRTAGIESCQPPPDTLYELGRQRYMEAIGTAYLPDAASIKIHIAQSDTNAAASRDFMQDEVITKLNNLVEMI